MDWRREESYAFTANLDGTGWAWQFLRRNPEYRRDYAWFIATWRALETDYGVPPERDFFRWKQDPRAWRAEAELAACGTDACPGENDQILIECWMGAKWGFRQFPTDPALEQPETLAWREQPIQVALIEPGITGPWPRERISLTFALALPLELQLESARRQLALSRHALAKAGKLPALTIRQGAPGWRIGLRILDGLEAGEDPTRLAVVLMRTDIQRDIDEARALCTGGYLRLLKLPD